MARQLAGSGGVGFARAISAGYYFRVERFEGATARDGDVLLEVTFNPEFVAIDHYRTDLLVEWNTPAKLEDWLVEWLRDLDGELCPPELAARATEFLFGPNSTNQESIRPCC